MSQLTVTSALKKLQYSNNIYVSVQTAATWAKQGKFVRIDSEERSLSCTYTYKAREKISDDCVAINAIQQVDIFAALGDKITCYPVTESSIPQSGAMIMEIDYKVKRRRDREHGAISATALAQHIKKTYSGQVFTCNQKLLLRVLGLDLIIKFLTVVPFSPDAKAKDITKIDERAILAGGTELVFNVAKNSTLRVVNQTAGSASAKLPQVSLFSDGAMNFDFKTIGVGGLSQEFTSIFRRAFAPRMLSADTLKQLDYKHVKGILLYGPPGTGKTHLAKNIGKMLKCKTVKHVAGGEILSKYYGEAEKNIKELFSDAVRDYEQNGDKAGLHLIIFDEIDALVRARGSSSHSVGDSVVNQLLTQMQGLNEINNVLVIGMTNRRDLIDSAMLRPGRFEVQVELGLPDEAGRLEILQLKCNDMIASKRLEPAVELKEYAKLTENFTGAELEGLVRNASSYAMLRNINPKKISEQIKEDQITIKKIDFDRAFKEAQPLFGESKDFIEDILPNPFIKFSHELETMFAMGDKYFQQVATSKVLKCLSVLVMGSKGSGKSSIAATMARRGGFKCIKVIRPLSFVGKSDAAVCNKLQQVFFDAGKSPKSCVVIDDIEKLIQYSPLGQRYSMAILQALMVYVSDPPIGKHKMIIIATTANPNGMISALQLNNLFNTVLTAPMVEGPNGRLSIQRALMDLEMARVLDTKKYEMLLQSYGKAFAPLGKLAFEDDENVEDAA